MAAPFLSEAQESERKKASAILDGKKGYEVPRHRAKQIVGSEKNENPGCQDK